jgi:hypothetical protein
MNYIYFLFNYSNPNKMRRRSENVEISGFSYLSVFYGKKEEIRRPESWEGAQFVWFQKRGVECNPSDCICGDEALLLLSVLR